MRAYAPPKTLKTPLADSRKAVAQTAGAGAFALLKASLLEVWSMVFKTGRAEQPSAWMVRFHRRSVAAAREEALGVAPPSAEQAPPARRALWLRPARCRQDLAQTSSLPSGHAASDLALALGASQELPLLFIPLSAATVGAHWALIRGREHYPSDVVVGGAIAIALAAAAWSCGRRGAPGPKRGVLALSRSPGSSVCRRPFRPASFDRGFTSEELRGWYAVKLATDPPASPEVTRFRRRREPIEVPFPSAAETTRRRRAR